MKIFSAKQVREWDQYTIKNEPIDSILLMERAADACFRYLKKTFPDSGYVIFCGPGNNGGDGLAIARLLHESGHKVNIKHVLPEGKKLSVDCQTNLDRIQANGMAYTRLENADMVMDTPDKNHIIIDALLGSGQSRPLSGPFGQIVNQINSWENKVVSIDQPTGLYGEIYESGETAIEADITLCFQTPRMFVFMPENDRIVGHWDVLDIGLSQAFYQISDTPWETTTLSWANQNILQRRKFSHKGDFGTAMLFCGSLGMMGAAVLAARACLRSGAGKVISRVPINCLDILQLSVPESICSIDLSSNKLTNVPLFPDKLRSIGIGSGIGKDPLTRTLVKQLLGAATTRMVWDADALNIIAEEGWQDLIPRGAVITPHILEFERLFGADKNHHLRVKRCLSIAKERSIYIVLKGAHTLISTPDGKGYFNTSGNAGMAKAGTGDVLTGILTGMLAQGYDPVTAIRLSVFLHGHAADMAIKNRADYSILASDIIDQLGKA